MISIRLSRIGRKNAPQFRVVVVPKHKDPWGKVLEIVGNYNPRAKTPELTLKADRIKFWLGQGAEATDTVWNLLVDQKIVTGKKHSVTHISKVLAKRLEDKKAKEQPAKPKEEAPKAA
jgi:small subunit ribosomal protein S16